MDSDTEGEICWESADEFYSESDGDDDDSKSDKAIELKNVSPNNGNSKLNEDNKTNENIKSTNLDSIVENKTLETTDCIRTKTETIHLNQVEDDIVDAKSLDSVGEVNLLPSSSASEVNISENTNLWSDNEGWGDDICDDFDDVTKTNESNNELTTKTDESIDDKSKLTKTDDSIDNKHIDNKSKLIKTDDSIDNKHIENKSNLTKTDDSIDNKLIDNKSKLTKTDESIDNKSIDDKSMSTKTDESIENKPIDYKSKLTKSDEFIDNKTKLAKTDVCNVNKSQFTTQTNEFIGNKPQLMKTNESIDNSSTVLEKESSWNGAWGNWGSLSSALSTAANSVTQGIANALETGIGVPDPEQLAREHHAEQVNDTEHTQPTNVEKPASFGFGNLVSGVSQITKMMESTSSKVIYGGLDTLETLGKKTMQVLQENDPGLKKKRAYLKIDENKPILSQILREAKEKSEANDEKLQFQQNVNYEKLFDDHQGLVHLEALELLSKQCEIKLETLISRSNEKELIEINETLEQVRELCELPNEDETEVMVIEDIKANLENAIKEINLPITCIKLISTYDGIDLINSGTNEEDIHKYAIKSLAHLTAVSVEQFHKMGELLLIKTHRSTAYEADSLIQLTSNLSAMITLVATTFSERLHVADKESINVDKKNQNHITNIFFEATNSCKYIETAFQLLIPVLQVGSI